jgi:hypothetical protein
MNEQERTPASFRETRAPQDVVWSTTIEDRAAEADRIKKVLTAPVVKREPHKPKSFFARIFG